MTTTDNISDLIDLLTDMNRRATAILNESKTVPEVDAELKLGTTLWHIRSADAALTGVEASWKRKKLKAAGAARHNRSSDKKDK